MGYLIALFLCIGLFGAYFAFVGYEARTGKRVFRPVRERMDKKVSRAVFIIRHVDWSAFLGESVRTGTQKAVHAIAEGSLNLVRTIERLLTRLVRALRERRSPTTARPLSVVESLKAMRDRFMHVKTSKVAEPVEPVSAKPVAEEPPVASVSEQEETEPAPEEPSDRRDSPRPSSIG